ncbi:MAG TPA: tRNA pseudouridine(55) synthase TruB [Hyphomicrobiaceae bacterium]|nr:tRNA pseudouridine(55) synthase TruB [Hyphomicrobiaceae bacterium]
MSRRRKGNPIHGWLVLDKPLGMTSTRAVGIVKHLFAAQKAGHAGTLDPLATGVLPIALGEATKTVSFAVEGAKAYRFSVRWGEERTTDDAEGEVGATSTARPKEAEITAVLARFIGEVMQVPPRFSAIKVGGSRAYDLARDGLSVELAPRPVVIDALRLVELSDADTAIFEARCGKGAYVRALARDMGRALGCCGHVAALRRTRVGPFGEEDAVTLVALEAAAGTGGAEALLAFLQPIERVLAGLPGLSVSPSDAECLARGQAVLIRGRDAPILSGLVYAVSRGRLIALGEVVQGAIHPTRVFHSGE